MFVLRLFFLIVCTLRQNLYMNTETLGVMFAKQGKDSETFRSPR